MATIESSAQPHPGPLSHEERAVRTSELLDRMAETSDRVRRRALLEEVVVLNLRVARALAQRFANRGVDLDDLVQVASEGLIKAAARFDPAHGRDFLSFAVPTVRGELQRHFRDSGWMVRPPRRIQEARWRITRVEGELSQRLGHAPSAEDFEEELELSPGTYAEAASSRGCFRPASLDQPTHADGDSGSIGDLIPDDDADLRAIEARLVLAPIVETLSDRDRRVLHLRYVQDLGQREIGEDIGVTQTQVSRILDRILDELRSELSTDDGAPGVLLSAS